MFYHCEFKTLFSILDEDIEFHSNSYGLCRLWKSLPNNVRIKKCMKMTMNEVMNSYKFSSYIALHILMSYVMVVSIYYNDDYAKTLPMSS